MILPNGRYRFLVVSGYEHEIFFTNSLPSQVLFRYFSSDPTDSFLMRLFVINPFALDVFDDGVKVNASATARPLINSTSGANQFDPQSECPASAGWGCVECCRG